MDNALITRKEKIADYFRNDCEVNKGNRIILVKENGTEVVDYIPNVEIHWGGKNAVLKIHENYSITKMLLIVGDNAYIEIGSNLRIRHSLTIDARAKNTTVVIGNNANIGRAQFFAGDEENLEIIVGDDFLCGLEFGVRNSDGHTIFDVNTKEVINYTEFGVHIGNHVWVGLDVIVLKDACIPNDCVIGAGAIVGKGDYADNSIIAGVPAKTIRTGINWDYNSICKYKATLQN